MLIYDTGHFASIWHKLAMKLSLDAQLLPGSWREGAKPKEIEQALAEDKDHTIKSVCVVHNDTATGITSDIPAIRKEIDSVDTPPSSSLTRYPRWVPSTIAMSSGVWM